MSGRSQHNYRTTELNPDYLSTPFGVQTNWHVITGAPCCGKTTLINLLANQGFQTVPETARLYIAREMAKGRTMDEMRANWVALQRGMVNMQLSVEDGLRAVDVAFLDRAVPDSLAFHRAYGLNPNDFLQECFHHRYASVFILDPLPFQGDGARDDDADQVGFLDAWLTRDYSALGYQVVRVPLLLPQERLVFVLERLSEKGLI